MKKITRTIAVIMVLMSGVYAESFENSAYLKHLISNTSKKESINLMGEKVLSSMSWEDIFYKRLFDTVTNTVEYATITAELLFLGEKNHLTPNTNIDKEIESLIRNENLPKYLEINYKAMINSHKTDIDWKSTKTSTIKGITTAPDGAVVLIRLVDNDGKHVFGGGIVRNGSFSAPMPDFLIGKELYGSAGIPGSGSTRRMYGIEKNINTTYSPEELAKAINSYSSDSSKNAKAIWSFLVKRQKPNFTSEENKRGINPYFHYSLIRDIIKLVEKNDKWTIILAIKLMEGDHSSVTEYLIGKEGQKKWFEEDYGVRQVREHYELMNLIQKFNNGKISKEEAESQIQKLDRPFRFFHLK